MPKLDTFQNSYLTQRRDLDKTGKGHQRCKGLSCVKPSMVNGRKSSPEREMQHTLLFAARIPPTFPGPKNPRYPEPWVERLFPSGKLSQRG